MPQTPTIRPPRAAGPPTAPAHGSLPRAVPAALRLTVALALPALCLLWAYWPTFATMWARWSGDPQYSHGFLVPVFALAILWSRRDRVPAAGPPCWWGVPVLAGCVGLRFVSAYLYLEPLDGLSLLPALAGVTLLVGGWPALRWSWPAIAFLGFMLPLPYQVEMALAFPLRRLATVASTYALQTLGYPALAEGNVILLYDLRLGVIDACNGLGMLFTFFALSTAAALITDRPLLDRVLIVASAVPIALVVNVARITLTAVAHVAFGREVGHALMHDLAGWLMMPMALALVWLELWYLRRLFVDEPAPAPLPLPAGDARAGGPPGEDR